jgi:outer membrane protein insertion porin family
MASWVVPRWLFVSWLVLAGASAALLCPHTLHALPAVSQGGESLDDDGPSTVVTVDSIRVQGLTRIPEETLLGIIDVRPGSKIAVDDLAATARAVIKRVFSTGYFSDVDIYSKEPSPGHLELTLVVAERYIIRRIDLVGQDEVEEEDIRKTFTVKAGRFLDTRKLVETLRGIEELYQEKGFYLAEASYEVARDAATRTAVVTIRIEEQAEVAVRQVIFVGNREIKEDELKAVMMTREKGYLSFLEKGGLFLRYFFQLEKQDSFGGAFVDEMAANQFESWSATQDIDLQRVKWFYMTRGFVEVRIGQPRIALTPDRKGVIITMDVDEGRAYTVGKVDVITDDPDGLLLEREQLTKGIKLRKDDQFNAQNVMLDTDMMSKQYMNKGYAFVSVSNSHYLDKKTGVIDLTYVVEKGKPTYVANIELAGNKTTADKVVRREMKIAEGDLYHQGNIDRSKAMIYRLGFFEEVEISHRPSPAPPTAPLPGRDVASCEFVDLVVKVKERDTGIFQVGAGFSSLESWILQARISKNNFLGRGQTIGVQALLSSLRQIYMLSFVEPYFLDTMWNFSFDLYNTATDYDAFTTETVGGDVSWGYKFFDDYFVYLTYKAEHMDTSLGGIQGYKGVPIEMLEPDGLTTSMKLSLAWDTRNNRIMPTEGLYNSVAFEWATPYLGGNFDFYRTTLNSRAYIPLFWNFVLRLNGTLGHITTNSDAGIPIFERYFVGGIFSVRGFRRNSLSPTVPAAGEKDPSASLLEFPYGGNKQLIFNAEIEIPIYREMGIVAVGFFDAGNAFAEDQQLSLAELRTSAGFGFRWWSPMGPLRFEWGFPLAPKPDEEPMVFEFTIGSAF